jgi:hypothetical protein
MKKTLISCFLVLSALSTSRSATITSVTVDGIRAYEKSSSADTNFYMGRISYVLHADTKESLFVDFTISKQGATIALPIIEKTGDLGFVTQGSVSDTLKIAYFRTYLIGDISGDYVANITAQANMSGMWKLADSLVKMMTIDQKAKLLYANMLHDSMPGFRTENFTLSNGSIMVGWRSADGPNGIRYPIVCPANDIAIYGSGYPSTVFATEAALGCTWDTTLARRVGQAIGEEARAYGLFCNLGPMSDLVINPRWGRAFETMGEDPILVAKMVTGQVKGIQSAKVIATPKHFTVYCKEDSRLIAPKMVVSERALRELFCVSFETAIKEGKARAIMTSYN